MINNPNERQLICFLIIEQLSMTLTGLEQIKANQFILYTELNKANMTINSIFDGIKVIEDNTRLTAYYAGITALIESLPKTIYKSFYII